MANAPKRESGGSIDDFVDRKLYLNLCRDASVGKQARCIYNGIEYTPIRYELGFRTDGSVIHTAILKDIKANALVYAPLEKVEDINE